jgi:hypothetical protein
MIASAASTTTCSCLCKAVLPTSWRIWIAVCTKADGKMLYLISAGALWQAKVDVTE